MKPTTNAPFPGARLLAMAAAAAIAPAAVTAQSTASPDVTVRQEPGKTVYWITPGPRELSERVFGTPSDPKGTLMPKVAAAEQMVADGKAPPTVPQLLKDLPILVAAPEKMRTTTDDGRYMFDAPTPFSDKGRIIAGSFEAVYHDNVAGDPPGPPGKTDDRAEMEASFTDPDGNEYRVVLDHLVKPPFPGYETDGGVMLDDFHHGATGTGSPLMAQVWTTAALWGIADVYINGELAEPNRVMHMMTTEVVRDNDYELPTDEELPLAPDEWLVGGQPHHTHMIVLPITTEGGNGPEFKPLETAFTLPNGKPQPFMHIMFEQDTIVR